MNPKESHTGPTVSEYSRIAAKLSDVTDELAKAKAALSAAREKNENILNHLAAGSIYGKTP